MIQEEFKAIKKFLETYACNIIYMRTARYTRLAQLYFKSKSEFKNSNLDKQPSGAISPRKF